MGAPDIRLGDFIRVYAGAGARRGGNELRRTLVLEVIALADPPGRPDWRFVSGRICRADLTHAQQLQHTCLEISGVERSILNLGGQWQLLRRPPDVAFPSAFTVSGRTGPLTVEAHLNRQRPQREPR